jgi:hypothetical protein
LTSRNVRLGFTPLVSQRATWHVPPEQRNVVERQSAAVNLGTPSPQTPSGFSKFLAPSRSSSLPSVNSSPTQASRGRSESPPDITREVALKAISKKTVKGNEQSVWGEMEVLKDLDHPNIVRPIYPCPPLLIPPPTHHRSSDTRGLSVSIVLCRSSFTSGSNQGQRTFSPSSLPSAASSLHASVSVATLQSEMPLRCFGTPP